MIGSVELSESDGSVELVELFELFELFGSAPKRRS